MFKQTRKVGPAERHGRVSALVDLSKGVNGLEMLFLSESILEAWPLENWALGYKKYVTGR